MNRLYILLLCCLPLIAFAQFSEDFLDGDITNDPVWQGTTDKFMVVGISASKSQLQLKDDSATTGTNRAYLSTESRAIIDGKWEATFTTATTLTSGNYIRFYLTSDSADLTGSLNGYFVWIGNSSKDISLYRQNGTNVTKIIDGADNRANGNCVVDIRVTRDSVGLWQLYSRIDDETDFTLEGSCSDKLNMMAKYSGFSFIYSKTNNTKYACQNIEASGKEYVKQAQNLKKNDIVFSEIMADPEPQVGLPQSEYLEIYNRTNKTIDLTNWKLGVNGKLSTISEGKIEPKTYAIICANSNWVEFAVFGNTITPQSWAQLTNSNAEITLYDDENNLIAWVEYSDAWYGDSDFKKDGGWSLERRNVDYLDNHIDNWAPSNNLQGGTPGAENSVRENLQDNRAPRLNSIAVDTAKITLHFSKSMDEETLNDLQNYTFDAEIEHIEILQPHASTAYLYLTVPLESNEIYTLELNDLLCVNGLELEQESIEIALPQIAEVGDLVLNEILFNPRDGGVDFVELNNISEKAIDLSQLFVTRRKNGELEERITICNEPLIFAPQSYLVLTSAPEVVESQYTCPADAHFVTVKLPTLANDEGNIVIALANATVIDEFSYTEKMHHPFVSNAKGVSLERVNPYAPTQQADNWQSASFEVGYATPSARNSQYNVPDQNANQKFSIEYQSFTPDNDGYRDLLPINYLLPNDGHTATIDIYTPTGVRVRRLLNGELLGTEGTIFWNGQDDSQRLCNIGVYVIHIEAVCPTGVKIQQKIVCVLSAK